MDGRDFKQDFIPYMGQLEFAIISIEGWTIDTDIYGLSNGPCDVLCLPTHYGKIVYIGMITCGLVMVIEGGMGPKMLPKPFFKDPCRFIYVLSITLHSVTLITVNYYTFLCDVFPIPGGHQEAPDGVASLETDLDPFGYICLKLLPKSVVWSCGCICFCFG